MKQNDGETRGTQHRNRGGGPGQNEKKSLWSDGKMGQDKCNERVGNLAKGLWRRRTARKGGRRHLQNFLRGATRIPTTNLKDAPHSRKKKNSGTHFAKKWITHEQTSRVAKKGRTIKARCQENRGRTGKKTWAVKKRRQKQQGDDGLWVTPRREG